MSGLRARVRAELTDEIKRLAREQMRTDGAANLSLRAISRDLDMASSAIYRYFASRDDLLTALIIDAYDALGTRAEATDAALVETDRDDVHARFRAVALVAFDWAQEEPAEYGLIFGTPVPGYTAPQDTIGPATRYTAVLLRILTDGLAAGRGPALRPRVSPALVTELRDVQLRAGVDMEPEAMLLALHVWTATFGAISFLLFGHLHNVIADERAFFLDVVDHLAVEILGEP